MEGLVEDMQHKWGKLDKKCTLDIYTCHYCEAGPVKILQRSEKIEDDISNVIDIAYPVLKQLKRLNDVLSDMDLDSYYFEELVQNYNSTLTTTELLLLEDLFKSYPYERDHIISPGIVELIYHDNESNVYTNSLILDKIE